MQHPEQILQIACVSFFRYQYPHLATLLHNNRNNSTSAREGGKHRKMGSVAGVADLVLYVRRQGFGALFIELKSETGRQSADQKSWQRDITAQGYLYVVVRTFDEFETTIRQYIND